MPTLYIKFCSDLVATYDKEDRRRPGDSVRQKYTTGKLTKNLITNFTVISNYRFVIEANVNEIIK